MHGHHLSSFLPRARDSRGNYGRCGDRIRLPDVASNLCVRHFAGAQGVAGMAAVRLSGFLRQGSNPVGSCLNRCGFVAVVARRGRGARSEYSAPAALCRAGFRWSRIRARLVEGWAGRQQSRTSPESPGTGVGAVPCVSTEQAAARTSIPGRGLQTTLRRPRPGHRRQPGSALKQGLIYPRLP